MRDGSGGRGVGLVRHDPGDLTRVWGAEPDLTNNSRWKCVVWSGGADSSRTEQGVAATRSRGGQQEGFWMASRVEPVGPQPGITAMRAAGVEMAERQKEDAGGEEIGDQTLNEQIATRIRFCTRGMEKADQGQPPAPDVDAVQVMTPVSDPE